MPFAFQYLKKRMRGPVNLSWTIQIPELSLQELVTEDATEWFVHDEWYRETVWFREIVEHGKHCIALMTTEEFVIEQERGAAIAREALVAAAIIMMWEFYPLLNLEPSYCLRSKNASVQLFQGNRVTFLAENRIGFAQDFDLCEWVFAELPKNLASGA